jgi:hypothetical protein
MSRQCWTAAGLPKRRWTTRADAKGCARPLPQRRVGRDRPAAVPLPRLRLLPPRPLPDVDACREAVIASGMTPERYEQWLEQNPIT